MVVCVSLLSLKFEATTCSLLRSCVLKRGFVVATPRCNGGHTEAELYEFLMIFFAERKGSSKFLLPFFHAHARLGSLLLEIFSFSVSLKESVTSSCSFLYFLTQEAGKRKTKNKNREQHQTRLPALWTILFFYHVEFSVLFFFSLHVLFVLDALSAFACGRRCSKIELVARRGSCSPPAERNAKVHR
ncbi:unnamed protein product [Amoebophrya sp. A120]|nr:unnamed protein product [Amoebophrya sp. A120]|eukprot:GSA120T00008857001.1